MIFRKAAIAVALIFSAIAPAQAGVTVYEDKDSGKKVEIGARLQLQYMVEDPDGGSSTDDLFFRRLRPYIAGTVKEDWYGKFQFELGKASDGNEVAVKDAYVRYSGFENLKVTVGNQKPPFSREFMTSSKRLQLVERSFAGDHNYGSPDRFLGVKLDGAAESKKLAWSASFGSSSIDPDAAKLDFDTPVNRNDDFNQGWLTAARVDFHPLGPVKYDQGNFRSDDTKVTISLAAYDWANDDDNNTFTDASGASTSASKADVDSADGFEISAGLRGHGFSGDVEYQMLGTDTIDPAFTGGIYVAGMSDLDILAFNAGYMFPANVELVAGHATLDADGYSDEWERTSFGINYFWNKHKAKLQAIYRMNSNLDGAVDVDSDEGFLQFQYVF